VFVADYIETSLLDWEGKISCVLFLSGCNFRCPWCHNKELALGKTENKIAIKEILKKFENKKSWIDGFVITGGEPTINKDLKEIISEVKSKGFMVKVDTNGSRPDMIRDIISNGLVDFISMDIKTVLKKDKYDKACGIDINLNAINQTIDILLSSNIGCSFRTTVIPGIVNIDDIKEIIQRVKGKKYTIQKFIPHNTLNDEYMKVKPYLDEEMRKMEEML
jgi:pyruvate formate lyase activating enzyme